MRMLEKLARALAEANQEDFDETPSLHLALADAALQSLKDLDEGTVEAMDTELFADCDSYDWPKKEAVSRAFTAAINHILRSGE